MNKRKFQLTPGQINELQGAYQQCTDGVTKIRYQAVRLYGTGYGAEEVIKITGCSRRRLMAWCRSYREYGVAGLIDRRVGGNSAKLSGSELEAVQTKLHQYRPNQLLRSDEYRGNGEFWSVYELAIWLEREFDVVYRSATSYRNVLKRCDMSRQRPAQQYKSRSEAKVMTFEEQLEKKLIDTAQEAPDTVIVAGDEASLYLQATVQVVWAPKGETPVVKVDPGRNNVHFYGAVNLQTGQAIVMRTQIMQAVTSVLFLLKLVLAYPDQKILLLWDRAPWHQGPALRDFLATHPQLEIFYFPPASPDLNPQEHVWKDARDHISHNHTINKMGELADKFEDYLTSKTFPCPLLDQHGYHQICAMFT